jgi:prepilin-type processing-associated H-X9-DG protein
MNAQSPTPEDGIAGSPPKTSGIALTSLGLGISVPFLPCGLGISAAYSGVVLGLIALYKIKKSNGRLIGWGVALTGTIVSVLILLAVATLGQSYTKARRLSCMATARQLATAVAMYADDHGKIPFATNWCDAILPTYVKDEKAFACPGGDRSQRCHYALNSKLAGVEKGEVHPGTVVIFETDGGWNAGGGPELLPKRARHGGTVTVGFADGHAQSVKASRLKELRWDP